MTKTAKTSAKRSAPESRLSRYLEDSRDPFMSILLVLPLFVLYQVGVLTTGGVRNGADFVSDLMWLAAGSDIGVYLGINLGLLAAFGVALAVLKKSGSFNPRIWPAVIAESTVYAVLLGSVVIFLMSSLGFGKVLASGAGGEYGFLTSIVLSLGAGLYEETVFRLVLMSGLFFAGTRAFKLPVWVSAVAALFLSSLLFSGIHYIGPLADTFSIQSFVFRFFAGALLAGIFYLRGFAVAVYTHAIYDIIVMVSG